MGFDQRLDHLLPVVLIDPIDLGRHLQPRPRSCGDFDGSLGTFLRRNAAEEGEVVAFRRRAERQQVHGKAMMHLADPVHRRHRLALIAGDRDERNVGKGRVDVLELRKIQPAVQGRDGPVREIADQRIVQDVEVEVENVEGVGQRAHAIEHHDMGRNRILDARVQAQCGLAEWNEPGRGEGVAASPTI